MAIQPLKMNQADVETAICRTFKQNFNQLQFNNAQSFSEIDSDRNCSFTLQRFLMEKEDTEYVVKQNCGISTI